MLSPQQVFQDRAYSRGDSAYPHLWRGLIGAWIPALSADPWKMVNNLAIGVPVTLSHYHLATTAYIDSYTNLLTYRSFLWTNYTICPLIPFEYFTIIISCKTRTITGSVTYPPCLADIGVYGFRLECVEDEKIRINTYIDRNESHNNIGESIDFPNNTYCMIVARYDSSVMIIERWNEDGVLIEQLSNEATAKLPVYTEDMPRYFFGSGYYGVEREAADIHGVLFYNRSLDDSEVSEICRRSARHGTGLLLPFVRKSFSGRLGDGIEQLYDGQWTSSAASVDPIPKVIGSVDSSENAGCVDAGVGFAGSIVPQGQ